MGNNNSKENFFGILMKTSNRNVSIFIFFFSGEKTSMIFILPNTMSDFSKMELKLNELISKPILFEGEKKYQVNIPKFNILASINLKEILKKIGLKEMFDQTHANFTGK